MKKLASIVVGTAAVLAGAAALIAATVADNPPSTYTSVANGNWTNPTTWDLTSGYPVAGDTVIIDGETVTITTPQAARSVTISSGQLRIDGPGCDDVPAELRFGAGETNPSLVISPANGVVLVDSARIVVGQSMAFDGVGSSSGLQGLGNYNAIVLAPSGTGDVVLTSELLLIHGALTIREEGSGQGYFINYGEVIADVPGGLLSIDSSIDGLDDSSSPCGFPRWQVTADDAVLQFGRGGSLKGNVRVGLGRLDINSTVSTEYLKITDGGSITPNLLTGWFIFEHHCPSSECPGISSPVIRPVRCHN